MIQFHQIKCKKYSEFAITIFLTLFEQVQSNYNYISAGSIILSLSNPEQEIDVKLESKFLNSKENIGQGSWVKYQPFIPISDKSYSGKGQISSRQLIYLLEQKEKKINFLTFSISISNQTQTITHFVFYSFKKINSYFSIFQYEKYKGKQILFYFYFNLPSESTMIGFYQLEQKITTKMQIVNDIPALVKEIMHQIGGKYKKINQLGEELRLTQFIGRLSTVFSQGSGNIFQDLSQFQWIVLLNLSVQGITYILSSSNQVFLGLNYSFGITSIFEYPIYVIKGWLKLQLFEKSPLDTVTFRVYNKSRLLR
ncbi:unnamed protein product [Paramecium primaurelia]|uniref:Uncharacterized protein n=1 Tax=Paramecium primaurelia TaxID=5886 RepID=A0A8S1KW67_PARPR|nr:unnamed protein product [Paramecium primaurelia]